MPAHLKVALLIAAICLPASAVLAHSDRFPSRPIEGAGYLLAPAAPEAIPFPAGAVKGAVGEDALAPTSRSGLSVVLMVLQERQGVRLLNPVEPAADAWSMLIDEWAYLPQLRLAAQQEEQRAQLVKKYEPDLASLWMCGGLGIYDPWSDPSVPKFWEMGFLDTYFMPKKSANTAYQVLYEAVERPDAIRLYFTGREGQMRVRPPNWPGDEREIFWRPYQPTGFTIN